ncbi:MAG: GerMN domain-containing protein [Agathobacter sp.]|nr:GerMN domain-containing protein [Agathobacter sp.]
MTKIVPEDYELQSETLEEQIEEVIEQLQTQPDSSDLRYALSSDVEILNYSMSGYQLTVDFSENYSKLTPSEEVLVRAAIARSLLGIPGISYVLFTVQSEPLLDAMGNVVGSMNSESFVENPGKQINSSIVTTLTLYFANSDGTALVKETREVHHSSNISMEKLVMEQLIEGPKESGHQASIPAETKLITSSVVDGVCYINLDNTFQNQDTGISETVLLYSIVNSLCELSNVEWVQISINGNTTGQLRYVCDLSVLYEMDLSYMEENVKEQDTQ